MAAATFVRNSPPGFRHTVVTPFENGAAPSAWEGVEADLVDLGSGHLSRIRKISKTVKRMRPQVVHAHSSFAGGYARIAGGRAAPRLVYSPHCFGFERRDLPRTARTLFHAAEWFLGWRTAVLAACSPTEQRQSDKLRSLRGKTLFVPNLPSISPAPIAAWDGSSPLRVAMIGRVSSQKDPAYFVRAITALREHVEVQPLWLGDGDSDQADALRREGVDVTGWLEPTQLAARLSTAHLYLHSAAWEGFPISVLDANALRMPMVVRDIAAFQDAPTAAVIRDEVALPAQIFLSASAFAAWSSSNRAGWDEYFAQNTVETQRTRLAEAWSASNRDHRDVSQGLPRGMSI